MLRIKFQTVVTQIYHSSEHEYCCCVIKGEDSNFNTVFPLITRMPYFMLDQCISISVYTARPFSVAPRIHNIIWSCCRILLYNWTFPIPTSMEVLFSYPLLPPSYIYSTLTYIYVILSLCYYLVYFSALKVPFARDLKVYNQCFHCFQLRCCHCVYHVSILSQASLAKVLNVLLFCHLVSRIFTKNNDHVKYKMNI